jgi:hypothetical protein
MDHWVQKGSMTWARWKRCAIKNASPAGKGFGCSTASGASLLHAFRAFRRFTGFDRSRRFTVSAAASCGGDVLVGQAEIFSQYIEYA